MDRFKQDPTRPARRAEGRGPARAFAALTDLLARHWRPVFFGLLLIVTAASLMPKGTAGDPGGGDKILHLLAYGAIAVPVALGRGQGQGQGRGWIWILVGVGLWSGAIELIQPLVGRHTHGADLAANLAGLGLGAVLGRRLG